MLRITLKLGAVLIKFWLSFTFKIGQQVCLLLLLNKSKQLLPGTIYCIFTASSVNCLFSMLALHCIMVQCKSA